MKADYIVAIMFGLVLLGALWALISGKLDGVHNECDAKPPEHIKHFGKQCICKWHKETCDCVPQDYFDKEHF